MDLNDIVYKIDASKEVLATMPKNNPKNIKIYKEKIEELLLKIVKPNDVILFKASNGMQFYKLAERMVEIWKK